MHRWSRQYQKNDCLAERPRCSGRRLRSRIACMAAAAVIGVTVPLAMPNQAQAWPWDGNVTIVGFAGCEVPGFVEVPAQETWVWLHDTGEIVQRSANFIGYNELPLTTVPDAGSWASIWEYCAVPGAEPGWRYVEDIWVTRQLIGSDIGPYWERA
jgi:hypothetical protein